ncbi:MAG: hypothetical protein MSH08_06100 [Ezakiella sp.]|nr:hypothetical protein [Ezakiella sp.]MDD7471898.1 hypothetical protein [Bacillota bacterium]MDY3923862.1 hypothetical protein [Ezakiella sp.]
MKNLSVKIAKNAVTVVSGLAGSGKNTFIRELFEDFKLDRLKVGWYNLNINYVTK